MWKQKPCSNFSNGTLYISRNLTVERIGDRAKIYIDISFILWEMSKTSSRKAQPYTKFHTKIRHCHHCKSFMQRKRKCCSVFIFVDSRRKNNFIFHILLFNNWFSIGWKSWHILLIYIPLMGDHSAFKVWNQTKDRRP